MRNNLACLGEDLTHLDVADMSNLFYFHFVFTWSRVMRFEKIKIAVTDIQFSQARETVMQMLMHQFKLTKS